VAVGGGGSESENRCSQRVFSAFNQVQLSGVGSTDTIAAGL